MSIELATILADFTTSLSASMVVGATTGTLQSATDDDGVALPTGRYFFTIDGSNSSKEHISCTLTGTALTAIKSVSRQGVETSGTARAHRLGASVTLTDFAHILAINDVLVDGYASATTPTTDYQLATKKYVDDSTTAGGSNATTTTQGFVELATQAEVDAGTATGGTGASLVATPATTRGRLYNDYAADAGGTDAYAITITPAITAYFAGQVFKFKANTANTGAATLAVSGLSNITIKKNVTSDLGTGDILANQIVEVVYDGTNFQMQTVSSNVSSGGTPVTRLYGTYITSSNARFDITNPAGSTFRYTYDGAGTDPTINASTFPVGNTVVIKSETNFNVGNNGTFVITGSGANYFEVTNVSGVAENDVTFDPGYMYNYLATWTKPTGLKYITVEVQAGGGGGGGNTTSVLSSAGGGGGGYARSLILAASLGATETVTVGIGGLPGSATGGDGGTGGTSSFGSLVVATGGLGGDASDGGGGGGVATAGDIKITGGRGASGGSAGPGSGVGGSSVLGGGGNGLGGGADANGINGGYYGGGGSGSASGGVDCEGGTGGIGVIIVTEYY